MLVNCESEERVGCNLGPGVSAAISSSEKYLQKIAKLFSSLPTNPISTLSH